MSVKSVYNFVPAPKENEVFKPDWAGQVSHDIPFSDGESGEIEIEIEAKTPIFIRNGHTKQDAEFFYSHKLFEKQQNGELPNPTQKEQKAINWYLSFPEEYREHAIKRYVEFSNVEKNGKKEYFIPGSSLKGMFRNVLEIMSLSRLNTANDIFGFRNLNHSKYKNEVATNKKIKTGWLVNNNGEWEIQVCDFGRFNYRQANRDGLTAIEKYENNNVSEPVSFSLEKDLGFGRGKVYFESNNGEFRGYKVFYGSIDNKKYEYIFTEPNGKTFNVSRDLIKRFNDIDAKLENTLWHYFNSKNPYPNNRIPVFFLADDESGDVLHAGFSRLYKLTNTNYLNELEPLKSYYKRRGEYQLDLAETIFGVVEDTDKEHGNNKRKQVLKGRVNFSHAFAKENITELEPIEIVLASPKASYFPFYLKNKKTYLDDAELKGFKKYPLHTKEKESQLNDENQEIETVIKPLQAGVKFRGKVRYHNLREVEIGALLSVLTFHGHNDILDHNIGSAKPLGYGRINIKVNNKGYDIDKYLSAFEDIMQKHCKKEMHKDWLELSALKELYAMSIDPVNEFLLNYPQIELEGANEFVNYVKNNTYLEDYSKLYSGKNLKFLSVKERYEYKKRQEAERKAQEERIAREKAKQEEIEQILKQSEEEKKIREEKNKAKREELKQKGLVLLNDVTDFNKGKNLIKEYKRKNNPIGEDQFEFIKKFVKKTIPNVKGNFKSAVRKSPWKDIKGWVGPETAQQWFDEIN